MEQAELAFCRRLQPTTKQGVCDMKKMLCLLILATFAALLNAQLSYVWAERAGGSYTENPDYGYAISHDSAGNSYVTGVFSGTATFGTYELISSGSLDIFVGKLDPGGNWLWAVRAGGSGTDNGYGIATDSSGNSYLCGSFQGAASFGSLTPAPYSGYDIYVAKLNTSGNWLWASSAGGSSADHARGIALDSAGNCYVTGSFNGTATFGTQSLTSYNSSDDIFVAKLNSSGTWQWAKKAGAGDQDKGLGIAADSNGTSYICGYFQGAASFGTTYLSNSGANDIFAAKLDTAGNWLWAKGAGGDEDDIGHGISLDSSGNCYLTGEFGTSSAFGTTTLTSLGLEDAFIAKLDSSGNWQWAKSAGSTRSDQGYAISSSSNGISWVSGRFTGAVDFGTTTLTSNTPLYSDIFIARLDASGNWLEAARAGGPEHDYGMGIAALSGVSAYLTGYFRGTADFGGTPLSSLGNSDIFVTKLSSPAEPGIPQVPENLIITRSGNDIHLTWNPVTQDTNGDPLTVSQYHVYYSNTDPFGTLTPHVLVSATSWTDTGAASQSRRFYLVRAVVPD